MALHRVTDVWPATSGDPVNFDLDFLGTAAGSQQVQIGAEVHALVQLMLTLELPYVYWRSDLNAVSTDASFGAAAQDVPEDHDAIAAEAMWNFNQQNGALFVLLENRSVIRVDFTSAAEIAAWMLAVERGVVRWEAGGLVMVRP